MKHKNLKNFGDFKNLNESIGDIYPIHIPNEVLNSGIFWESGEYTNVNLGNLINSLKEHYGYIVDNFDNQESNTSDVEIGNNFIRDQYNDLYDKNGNKTVTLQKAIGSPNSFYVKHIM